MGDKNNVSVSDDEEDLEALRLKALQSLKKKNVASNGTLQNTKSFGDYPEFSEHDHSVRPGNRSHKGFHGKRGRFFGGRGVKNGQFYQGFHSTSGFQSNRTRSNNLISITPLGSEKENKPTPYERSKDSDTKLTLPQDRYISSTKSSEEVKADSSSSKFDRYKDTDDSEEESEDEILKTDSEDDSPKKLERADSLEALMQELDDEIHGRPKEKDEEKTLKIKAKSKPKKEGNLENTTETPNENQEEVTTEAKSDSEKEPEKIEEKIQNDEPEICDQSNNQKEQTKQEPEGSEPAFKKRRFSPPRRRGFNNFRGKNRNFQRSPPYQPPPFLPNMGPPPFLPPGVVPVFNPAFGPPNIGIPPFAPPPFVQRPLSPLHIDADSLQNQTMAPLSPRSAAFVLKNKKIIEQRKRSPRRSYSRSPSPGSRSLSPMSPRRSLSPRRRSRSPRRRSLSPKRRSLSPKRPFSPRQRPLSPKQRPLSPRSRSPKQRPLSPKLRPLSPRLRTLSPKSRPLSPRQRPLSPKSRPLSPRQRPLSPKSRPLSPRQRPLSPKSRPLSPRQRPSSPKLKPLSPRRAPSPRPRALSPRQRALSPRPRPLSPRSRPISPRQRPLSPKSPRRRSISPRRRSISPRRRSLSPRRRSLSPRRRSLSPKRRSPSPKKRSQSPRRRSISPRRRERKEPRVSPKPRISIRERLGLKPVTKPEDKEAKEYTDASPKKDDKPMDPVLEARRRKFETKEIKVREGIIRLRPKEDARAEKDDITVDKKNKRVDRKKQEKKEKRVEERQDKKEDSIIEKAEAEIVPAEEKDKNVNTDSEPKQESDNEVVTSTETETKPEQVREKTEEELLEEVLLADDELDLEPKAGLLSDLESDSENEGRFKEKTQQGSKPTILPFSKLTNGEKKGKERLSKERKEKKSSTRTRARSRSPIIKKKDIEEDRVEIQKPDSTKSLNKSVKSERKRIVMKSERHPTPKRFERKIEIKIKNPSKYEKDDKKREEKEEGEIKEVGGRRVELGCVGKPDDTDDDSETEIVVENDEEEVENSLSSEGDLRAQLSKKRAEKAHKYVAHEEVQSRLLQNALQNVLRKPKKSKSKELTSSDGKLPIHLRLGFASSSEPFGKQKRKSKKRKHYESEEQV